MSRYAVPHDLTTRVPVRRQGTPGGGATSEVQRGVVALRRLLSYPSALTFRCRSPLRHVMPYKSYSDQCEAAPPDDRLDPEGQSQTAKQAAPRHHRRVEPVCR